MAFKRFVEIGRICLISYGRLSNRLCVIVDVMDQNHVIIDAADGSPVQRQVINLKRLNLTDLVVKLPRGCKSKTVHKVMAQEDVEAKFAATAWGRKIARQRLRASLNDFDRFKVMVARKRRSYLIGQELGALRKEQSGGA